MLDLKQYAQWVNEEREYSIRKSIPFSVCTVYVYSTVVVCASYTIDNSLIGIPCEMQSNFTLDQLCIQ